MKVGAYRILPESNRLLDGKLKPCLRSQGLGPNLKKIRDNVLLDLLAFLDPASLARLSCSSRAFHLLADLDIVWRDIVLNATQGKGIDFTGSWKQTFVHMFHSIDHKPCHSTETDSETDSKSTTEEGTEPSYIYYSDDLFHQFLCVQMDVSRMCPGMMTYENIPRISAADLSLEEFVNRYELPNRPVIITDAFTHWPAFSQWTRSFFEEGLEEGQVFRSSSATASCGAVFSMPAYFHYADQTQDEVPLYLFDKGYASARKKGGGVLEDDYEVPVYFDASKRTADNETDLFSVLGSKRPDHRWIIIGPRRSGSLFHIDPNQTHAWNAVLKGRKKWIFYPPHAEPPGVCRSADGGEVTVPVSLAEWLLAFWAFHREQRLSLQSHPLHPVYDDDDSAGKQSSAPLECIQGPGDLVFVPHGYWHMVYNLEDTIALTHNYVSRGNLSNVLRFLRDTPDQITGMHQPLYPAAAPSCTETCGGTETSPTVTLYESFLSLLPGLLREEAVREAVQQSLSSSSKTPSANAGVVLNNQHRKRRTTEEWNQLHREQKKPKKQAVAQSTTKAKDVDDAHSNSSSNWLTAGSSSFSFSFQVPPAETEQ
eukprot:gene9594-10604_t